MGVYLTWSESRQKNKKGAWYVQLCYYQHWERYNTIFIGIQISLYRIKTFINDYFSNTQKLYNLEEPKRLYMSRKTDILALIANDALGMLRFLDLCCFLMHLIISLMSISKKWLPQIQPYIQTTRIIKTTI